MVQVLMQAAATQTGGGPNLPGYLTSTMPGLSTGDWVGVTAFPSNTYVQIGADGLYTYLTPSADLGIGDNDVFRCTLAGGALEQIAGSSMSRIYGKVNLVLPIGEGDAILFGRTCIARVQGEVELWRILLSGQVGVILADCAALTGGTVTVAYQRADFANYRQIDYKYFSFPLALPAGTSNMATWGVYGIDWGAIEAAAPLVTPFVDPAAVLSAIAPSLDYGFSTPQTRSADGWAPEPSSVVTDAFIDGGNPTVTYYGRTAVNDPVINVSSVTSSVTISSGVIVAAARDEVVTGDTVNSIPLPAQAPGYTAWDINPYFRYAVGFATTPPEAFWTNLRRSVEVV